MQGAYHADARAHLRIIHHDASSYKVVASVHLALDALGARTPTAGI